MSSPLSAPKPPDLRHQTRVLPTFVYNGNGNRVKATVSGITTSFIGTHFKWKGSPSTMVKYSYAGGSRIAMRTGGSANANLKWLLGDHLGSTSLTADYNAANPVTTLYKPWGEIRYQSGTLPTQYTYTGQYSHTGDFGLMYYVARWDDPVLGRFAQADSIIPATGEGGNQNAVGYVGRENYLPLVVDYHENQFLTQLNEEMRTSLQDEDWKLPPVPTNPTAFDRYAYSFNNPMRYIDPSGHFAFVAALALITPVGWVAIGVTTVAVVAYFAIPGVQEAVTTTTTQALDAASNGINALLAKKSDIAWMDWLSKKYGLLPDEREWLHQQMKKHGLTAEEIIEEIEEIIRLRDEEESGW